MKATKRLDAKVLTEDGILDIEAKMDSYGFILAQLKIDGNTWEDCFSEPSELKEFIEGLPVIQVLDYTTYDSTELQPA